MKYHQSEALGSRREILLLSLTALGLYQWWKVLSPFFSVMAWATILAVVAYPMHRRILARILRWPSLAAALSTLLVLLAIIFPLMAVGVAVGNEMRVLLARVPDMVTEALQNPDSRYSHYLQAALSALKEYVGVDAAEIRSAVQQGASRLSSTLFQNTVSIVGTMLGSLVTLAMVVFTIFFLFRDGDRAVSLLGDWLPLRRERGQRLIERTGELINASLYGVVATALVQGGLGGLMFWLLGLPSPLLWTVVMSLLAIIPLLGTFVVWVPAAIFLAAVGSYGKAAVLVAWGIFVVGSADNLLRPWLVGQRTRMHELLIFFSVLGGIDAFGILGVVFGPVISSIAIALLEAVRADDSSAEAVEQPRYPHPRRPLPSGEGDPGETIPAELSAAAEPVVDLQGMDQELPSGA